MWNVIKILVRKYIIIVFHPRSLGDRLWDFPIPCWNTTKLKVYNQIDVIQLTHFNSNNQLSCIFSPNIFFNRIVFSQVLFNHNLSSTNILVESKFLSQNFVYQNFFDLTIVNPNWKHNKIHSMSISQFIGQPSILKVNESNVLLVSSFFGLKTEMWPFSFLMVSSCWHDSDKIKSNYYTKKI